MAALACALASCRHPAPPPEEPDAWGVPQGRGSGVKVERAPFPKGAPAPVMAVLERELEVNLGGLQAEGLEPAYFLAYDMARVEGLWLEAREGVLVRADRDLDRTVDVDVRVGSRKLDNSRPLGDEITQGQGLGSLLPVSLQDEELSIAQSLWLETDRQYRSAVAALAEIRSEEELRSQGTDEVRSPDFSEEKPLVRAQAPVALDLDAIEQTWAPVVRRVSQELAADPRVLESRVVLVADVENHHFINSEGTRVQHGRVRVRVILEAQAQAEDGMVLGRHANFDAHVPEQLPPEDTLLSAARRVRSEVLALREAPLAEPYIGPALLDARSAAVFFHELVGHRLEGHRQKLDEEGQTFTGRLGKRVLPWFLDVVDDPTAAVLGGVPLAGHYFVDDEGVPAERTVLIERGKLKTFLLARSPVLPFRHSNGHGRRERGNPVVARQGNLIVTSRRTMGRKALRHELLAEVRRQGKPYGLLLREVDSGYTLTDRSGPQAFKVVPTMVYRVYADGRPDELVRGADLVGTPLSAFETIVATGERPGVFNGMCGAESGWVPVSAVSPAILLRTIEIERASHERDRPPLLPPPAAARTREGEAP